MNFESLANELLLDLFEYFDGINLFRSFYGLNSRLNQLLCYHFRSYYFDFRSISKHNFDLVCQEYFPLIIDRIISLTLSNDDETPNLPEIFLSRGFIFNQFTHLQSLSLYCIYSLDILNEITIQCRYLLHLKHLNIINFYVDYEEDKAVSLMNNIWNLKLIHCHLDNFYSGGRCFFGIQIISTSIKYLSIDNMYCDLNILDHLFQYTPNLQQLSIASDYSSDDQPLCMTSSLINSFKLSFEGSIDSITYLFQNLPNLCYLTLKTSDICLNGCEWEKIIVDYLPKIKRFRLRMNFYFTDYNDKDEQVEELLNTFQTYFWIEQHQWFVQCDWEPFDSLNRTILYTLPYDFEDFFYFDTIKSKSTCSNTKKSFSYNHVNVLRHSFCDTLPLENSIFLSPKFYNIYDLKINIPFNNNFWSCIPSLDQLHSLNVTIREDSAYSQLQILLNRAPHLYSLILRSSTNSQMNLLEITSISIRRLDLMTKSTFRLRYFNNEECNILAHSTIGNQCEVLLISVENRENICEIIKIMSNLRSLTFQCKDDKWKYCQASSTNDELLQWLSEHLSSTFLIIRDKNQTSKIHIWIK